MQLDVDIEPTLRFPHMTSIGRQMDKSEGSIPLYMHFYHRQTDRQTESDAQEPTVQLAQVGSKRWGVIFFSEGWKATLPKMGNKKTRNGLISLQKVFIDLPSRVMCYSLSYKWSTFFFQCFIWCTSFKALNHKKITNFINSLPSGCTKRIQPLRIKKNKRT